MRKRFSVIKVHVNQCSCQSEKAASLSVLQFGTLQCIPSRDRSSSWVLWCRESHNHVKALYRRAMAYIALGEFERAEEDLNKWKEVEPNAVADAAAQISKLKAVQKAANAKQKQQFKNFFGNVHD